ncbi:Ig domain-containing protein [Spirosoma oryzicola]|uniref:Ig domain-containing protein n=1 Tax=Spirosoma oryzicola TaxID=2898794 RepID=UPI001E2FAC5F|nr:Ig domain-containing protein [Spirosoma oryzicola]UHG93277.1 Ig domain-containing protein [Spirosoma oryzicola]
MTSLKSFLSDGSSTGAVVRVPANKIRLPKSNFVAVAFLPKNTLPELGSSYTPPGGTAATLTAANLVSVITLLAINGIATVFGNGTVSGKRGKYKADEETTIFGSQRTAEDTDEGEIVFEIMFKYAYHNTEFMNQLRKRSGKDDIYFFTDRSVEVVRADIHEPVYKNSNNGEVTGNNKENLTSGGFGVIIGSDGDIVPEFGNFEKSLSASNFQYTFGVPTVTGTGLTASLSGTVINKTAPGTGTIANAVAETVTAGVVAYRVYLEGDSALPAGITIDSATGTVTVAANLTAGSYKVIVAAENKVGVIGEYRFTLIAA